MGSSAFIGVLRGGVRSRSLMFADVHRDPFAAVRSCSRVFTTARRPDRSLVLVVVHRCSLVFILGSVRRRFGSDRRLVQLDEIAQLAQRSIEAANRPAAASCSSVFGSCSSAFGVVHPPRFPIL